MSDNSKIEWTDKTWNVLVGCTKANHLCNNCCAMRDAHRLQGNPNSKIAEKYAGATDAAGEWTGKINFYEPELLKPLHWKKPSLIFPNFTSDWAHSKVLDEQRNKIFAVMHLADWHVYQLLTKRSKIALKYLSHQFCHTIIDAECFEIRRAASRLRVPYSRDYPLVRLPMKHVLIGVSVGDQETADRARETMRRIAALGWFTWVSYEPALGPVDWSGWEFIKWIVAGGESARPRSLARPSHPDWFDSTRRWARGNLIPFNFKQWGEWAPAYALDGRDVSLPRKIAHEYMNVNGICKGVESTIIMNLVGKKAAGRLLDGQVFDEMPEVQH